MDESPWIGRAKKLLAITSLALFIWTLVEIAMTSWVTGLPPQR